MIERVCVVGAGVIGSLFAGHLARVAEVSVLCRRDEHARALNEHGLRVTGKAEFDVSVSAATSAAELPAARSRDRRDEGERARRGGSFAARALARARR